MSKIELSEKEKEVIQEHLNGKIHAFTATPEQQELLTSVIHKADALMDELDAWDDDYTDLILWFWNKYQDLQEVS